MFRKLNKTSSPRKELKKEIWQKLSIKSDAKLPRLERPLIFKPVFLSLVLILGAGFGTGVYAYESPSVDDNHPFYGIKRAIENVEFRLAYNSDRKAVVQLKLAEKRLNELEYKVKVKRRANKKSFEKLVKVREDLESASSTIPKVKNPGRARELRNHLEDIRVNKIQRVRKLLEEKSDFKEEQNIEINLNNKSKIDLINNNFDAHAIAKKASLGSDLKIKRYGKD